MPFSVFFLSSFCYFFSFSCRDPYCVGGDMADGVKRVGSDVSGYSSSVVGCWR